MREARFFACASSVFCIDKTHDRYIQHEGVNRLRVGGMRIIYRQISGRDILLEYANTRDAVFELYEQILANRKKLARGP